MSGDIMFFEGRGAYTPEGRIGDTPPACRCGERAVTLWQEKCPCCGGDALATGNPDRGPCRVCEGSGVVPLPLCKQHAGECELALADATPPGARVPLALYLNKRALPMLCTCGASALGEPIMSHSGGGGAIEGAISWCRACGQGWGHAFALTTWSGAEVLRVTAKWERKGVNFGGTARTYWQAINPRTGAHYYGTALGVSMLARARRCK